MFFGRGDIGFKNEREKKMKQKPIRKTLQYIWFVVLLFTLVSAAFAKGSAKSEKEQLNEKFGKIAREMQEFYDNEDMDEVRNLFNKHCVEYDKMTPKAGKTREEFKKVDREIRAYIYRLVAFSYFELDQLGLGDDYLRKLSKSQLNEAFREIAREMKEAYDNGILNNVINLYKKYCCKNDKEKMVFKRVEDDIRADIYRLVALSYDDVDETRERDNYLERILDIRPHMESGIYRPSWREMVKNKYIVLPRLLLGFNGGANITIPYPYRNYSILGPTASTEWNSYSKDYSYNLAHLWGAHLAGVVEYTLTKNFSINVQVSTISLTFRYKTNLKWEGEGEPISLNFLHSHHLYYIEIPLFLKYLFVEFGDIKPKLKPYLQIGGFLRILEFAHKTIDSVSKPENTPDDTKSFYLKKLINRINSGFCMGAGISYDTKFMGFPFRLEFGVNYKHGFNNIVDKDQRYKAEDLVFGYYDVFDDIKLRSWDLSFKILVPMSFKAFER